jgi:hypothetical protein
MYNTVQAHNINNICIGRSAAFPMPRTVINRKRNTTGKGGGGQGFFYNLITSLLSKPAVMLNNLLVLQYKPQLCKLEMRTRPAGLQVLLTIGFVVS